MAGWLGQKPPVADHHPVAQKDANPFGLHDMHGNVFEFCEDRFRFDYDGAPTDGSPWVSGPSRHSLFSWILLPVASIMNMRS